MAFTVTARHTGTSGATAVQTQATDSVTPTASSLLLAFAGVERDLHTVAESWSFTGGGTWTSIANAPSSAFNGTSDFNVTAALQRLTVGGSPSAHTITADAWSGVEDGYYSVVACDITGHNTSSPIVQSKTGGATEGGGDSESLAVTFDSALTNGNLVVACFAAGNDAAGAFTAPTIGGQSMTQLHNLSGTFCHVGMWYRVLTGAESNATVTCSDLGQSVGASAAVLVEVALAGGGATVTPAVIATTVAVPQATPSAGVTQSPAVVASTVAVPQAVASAGVVQSPAVIAATAAVPQATPRVDAVVTPGVIAVVASLPQATPVVGGSVTTTPATIAATVSLPAATPSAAATVTPPAIAAVAAVPQATPATGTTVAPAVIVATVAVPPAGGSVTAGPATIAVVIGLPAATPVTTGGATVTPAAIAVQVLFPAATAVGFGAGNGAVTVAATLPGDVVRRTVTLTGTIR